MYKRFPAATIVVAAMLTWPSDGFAQTWSFPGISNEAFAAVPAGGPAPRRDLTGLWDPGVGGIAGGERYFDDNPMAPFTPLGEEMMSRNKPTHGPRSARVAEGNDPLTTGGDPSGFPRIVNYEFRPVRIVHTPISVLMLYSFNQTWRVIWTDGRQLPEDPDPRWFGYSVGHYETLAIPQQDAAEAVAGGHGRVGDDLCSLRGGGVQGVDRESIQIAATPCVPGSPASLRQGASRI